MTATPRVALLVDTSTGYSSQLIQGVALYAREHEPWQLLVQPRGARERWQMPRHWQPDGVIARITHKAQARELRRLRLPAINVSRSAVPAFGFPQVTIDEEALGVWAADHLLQRGFRNFGYCGLTAQPHYTDRCGPAYFAQLSRRACTGHQFRPFSQSEAARVAPTNRELQIGRAHV